MADYIVHVTPADAEHRSPAGLTLERYKSERFFQARMHEEVSRTVILCQLAGIGAVWQPGDLIYRQRKIPKQVPLLTISYDEQVEVRTALLGKQRERFEQGMRILLRGQPAHVEEQDAARGNPELFAN